MGSVCPKIVNDWRKKSMSNAKSYRDTSLSPAERAELLLEKLSVEEKMAQLICVMPFGSSAEECLQEAEQACSVGIGNVSSLVMREHRTLEESAQLQRKLQSRIMELSPHHIPAIFHMEGTCGAFLPGAASFPSGYGRGASWDPQLERQIGAIVGRQERAVGITQTLAPVLDVSREPRMGRCAESYGEDPTLVSAMGTAYLEGLQQESTGGLRTQGVAKHFLGFHASEGGIHGTGCTVSFRQMREVYGKPFQAAISKSGLRGIMPCYNPINGVPVSASAEIMTELLRGEMGFDGICVSDYCAVRNLHFAQKMFDSAAEAGYAAMSAGMDVEYHYPACFNSELTEQFRSGLIDMAVLDRAARKVLEIKFGMGLFEHPFALEGEALHRAFHKGSEEDICLQIAQESLVLLKNDGMLPLQDKHQKIAVIGCFADDPRFLFGGYTHFSMAEGALSSAVTMAGVESSNGSQTVQVFPGTSVQRSDAPQYREVLTRQKPNVQTLLDELRQRMPKSEIVFAYGYDCAGTDESRHSEALQAAQEADLVIVTLGGKNGTSIIATMGEGVDGVHINLPSCQESFLRKLSKLGKKVAAVHFDGRPISSDAAQQCCNAILEAWNPAEGGSIAVAEALTGAYNPGGKLPVSVAYTAGQIPVYYNHYNNCSYHKRAVSLAGYVDCPHTPRYFFGHGLSYTAFRYSDLTLSSRVLQPGESLQIRLNVTNTGKAAGDEVVQLYIRDELASILRPVQELAGFCRVHLLPGETKQITFRLCDTQLAFLDMNRKWRIERGDFTLRIGASSEDIRLTDTFRVTQTHFTEGKERSFWANAQIS